MNIRDKAGKEENDEYSLYDSPERIQECLSCPKPFCDNCHMWTKRVERKRTRIETVAILEAWVDSDTERQLATALGIGLGTSKKYRMSLGLPPPGHTNKGKRMKIYNERRMELGL